ncbi:MAG: alpha/beta hydrolase [Pseudomonadota bacterium]
MGGLHDLLITNETAASRPSPGRACVEAGMVWHLEETCESGAGSISWGMVGSGRPSVVAHGWPQSRFAWHRVLDPLTDHFTVYGYNMPGFGQSDKALHEHRGIDAQGVMLAELLQYWQLDHPSVWAHDFGGAVTLRALLVHGYQVDRHLSINVVAMRPWGSAFFDHVRRHIDAVEGLPTRIHAGIVSAFIGGALIQPLEEEDRDALEASWRDSEGQKAVYRQFAQTDEALTAESEPHFATLHGEIHVLRGADDPLIPMSRGQALAEANRCEIEPMPNLGHRSQLENPDQVANLALTFLTKRAA